MATVRSSDQISLVDLTDGYSVILTNDSFTFPGTMTTAVAGSTTTQIIAMCGASTVAATVDTSEITAPTGVTVTKNNDATSPTLTIAVTTAVTSGGTIDIPVHIGDITIHKMFTYSIAFVGQTGAAGTNVQWYTGTACTHTSDTAKPATGISAAKVGDMYLNTSSGLVYTCTTAGASGTAVWTYKGSIKGATGDNVQWYSGTGITGTSTTAAVFSGSGVSAAKVGDMYLNTSTSNTYRCTVAGAASAAKWVYVNNIKGQTGAAGEDAITMTITSSAGTIFKNSAVVTTLTAHVYKGGVEVTGNDLTALGTIKWYKDGSSTAAGTGTTLAIGTGDVTNKATYVAQLETA